MDLKKFTWEECHTKGGQRERSSHGSVLIGDRIYVFGGIVTKTTQRLNDMQFLTLSTMQWQNIEPKGKVPCPMYGSNARAGWKNNFLWRI